MGRAAFVKGCRAKYRWESLPDGDKWHDAHDPTPECLGGTRTIKLWRSDHAAHGVWQSEEYGHPCIYGWEGAYLDGWLYNRWKYWMRVKARPGWEAAWAKSQKVQRERKICAHDPSRWLQKLGGRHTDGRHPARLAGLAKARAIPGHQSKAGKLGGKKGKRVFAKRLADGLTLQFDTITQAAQCLNVSNGVAGELCGSGDDYLGYIIWYATDQEPKPTGKKRGKPRYVCLLTGKVASAGGLTVYQRRRGIDPSLRCKLEDYEQSIITHGLIN